MGILKSYCVTQSVITFANFWAILCGNWATFHSQINRSESIAEAEEAENFFDVAAKSMDEMREMLRSTEEAETIHDATG